MERFAIVVGQTSRARARFGVVPVHVENRCLDHLGDVRRVIAGARRFGGRRESDLIVDDDVDGAANSIPRELRHVERLGDHALTRESRVTVDEDGEIRKDVRHVVPLRAIARMTDEVLLRSYDPFDDRTHRLEV